jgi:hypothetical protein
MIKLIPLILFGLLVIVIHEWISGYRIEKKEAKELEALKSLPNYGKIVKLRDGKRTYIAKISLWEVPGSEGMARLWSIEGPNPNGYTKDFLWPHKELEFLE